MERVDVSYESTNDYRIYKLISREQRGPCDILRLGTWQRERSQKLEGKMRLDWLAGRWGHVKEEHG